MQILPSHFYLVLVSWSMYS